MGRPAADHRQFIAKRLADGMSKATINRELSALKRMFTLCIEVGTLLYRPKIKMLEERNARKGFLERAQFDSVRAHLPAALQGVATFAYITGWRTKSEILPLKWAQIDRTAGTVRLEPNTTKNDEGRTFVYDSITELRELIDKQWEAHEELKRTGTICPSVFYRMKGPRKGPKQPQPIRSWRRAWIAAAKAAGCPGRIPHDFRRTAVRNLVRWGVSEQVAMKMTGHKTRSVFDRYDIVSGDDLVQAGVKVNAGLMGTITGTIGDQRQPNATKASA